MDDLALNAPGSAPLSIKPNHLASPARRLGGQLIDSLITLAVVIGTLYLLRFLNLQDTHASVLPLTFGAAYYFLSDALPNGQSIGKRLLNMAVVDFNTHGNCTLVQSVVRNLTTPFLGFFDWIFIFFGSKRRLGDMLAMTLVINTR